MNNSFQLRRMAIVCACAMPWCRIMHNSPAVRPAESVDVDDVAPEGMAAIVVARLLAASTPKEAA